MLPLHTQADHFFLEKCGERCCKHSLGTSPHQIPLIGMKKDLDHRLEKRASARLYLIIIDANIAVV